MFNALIVLYCMVTIQKTYQVFLEMA